MNKELIELKKLRPIDPLVHETFSSPLGDTGEFEGRSVIRTDNGGVWYADSADPDDDHIEVHAEIVRRVNTFPSLISTIEQQEREQKKLNDQLNSIAHACGEACNGKAPSPVDGFKIWAKQLATLTAERDTLKEENGRLRWALKKVPCSCLDGVPCDRCVALSSFALSAPYDKSQWRPIETAPVNQAVLVSIPNAEHYGPGVYRAIQVNMGTGKRWMTSGFHVGRDLDENCQPDLWMPLPQPPTKGGEV